LILVGLVGECVIEIFIWRWTHTPEHPDYHATSQVTDSIL